MPAASSPILLVAEGADWLVVSKPPHLLVHPTRPGGPATLLDALRALLAYEIANGGQVSLIHRLDRETSGLLLAAKTAGAARRFSLDMMRGRIAKEYLALVWGWPEWNALTVDAPLLRLGEKGPSHIWLKRAVHPDGAAARTRFEVLSRASGPHRRTAAARTAWCGRCRKPGGCTRFVFIWPTSDIRWWVIKSMVPTRSVICASLQPGGRPNSPVCSGSTATRCTPGG